MHLQGIDLHTGQPDPYFDRATVSRSILTTFARLTSHAKTSANSSASLELFLSRTASASSPISSTSHSMLRSGPLALSLVPYISSIKRWKSEIFIFSHQKELITIIRVVVF